MKWFCCLVLAVATVLSAKGPRRFERPMYAITGSQGWLDLFGSWDNNEVPYILSVIYSNRWDANLMQRDFHYPDRLTLTGESGKVYSTGISVMKASGGDQRSWSAYVPHYEPYKSYQVIPRGATKIDGKLEPLYTAPPKLRIVEGKGGFSWAVTNTKRVMVDVSVNDGETWDALGDTPKGVSDLKSLLAQFPVVRIQAFQGLHVFVDFYIPGEGIVEDGWPYRQPTYFLLPSPPKRSSTQFCANPRLMFGPADGLPEDFKARIKFTMNWKRLPFDPQAIFPGQIIQKVFQAEWKYRRATVWDIDIDERFLNDPKRTNNLKLTRVVQASDGSWSVDWMFPMCKPHYPSPPEHVSYIAGFRESESNPHYRMAEVSFDEYWIIVSD